MPYVESDGVKLYFEEAGSGDPILFVHEFADDLRSWEMQVICSCRPASTQRGRIGYNSGEEISPG